MDQVAEFLGLGHPVIHVTLDVVAGSTPRDADAQMFVSEQDFAGTIGGGQLEYIAIDQARNMLKNGLTQAELSVPLGPEIGQCCGGRVGLRFNLMDRDLRLLILSKSESERQSYPQVQIYGAGHVGRALARALMPLPFNTSLIDSRGEELVRAGEGVRTIHCPLPEALVRQAPKDAAVLVMTHDHALDFLIASEALAHGARYVGMIGSRTKREKFKRFCADHAHGVNPHDLICPIGGTTVRDKRPEVIAALVVAELINEYAKNNARHLSRV